MTVLKSIIRLGLILQKTSIRALAQNIYEGSVVKNGKKKAFYEFLPYSKIK